MEDPEEFIKEKIEEIKETVGSKKALVALSGGVDSSTVAMLAHRAIGEQSVAVFIDNGLMREKEGEWVKDTFAKLGIKVEIINAGSLFFRALQRITDPEEKRKQIEWCFYGEIFPELCQKYEIEYWLQGTILTDIEETKRGIKRQHNVWPDICPGIYGLPQGITPLKKLRKPEVRQVAKALGLPKEIYQRKPFLGPALAGRIIGEVTLKKVELLRKATVIVEKLAEEKIPKDSQPFQIFPALLNDQATGIRDGKREFGHIIVIRSVESEDAREARASKLPWDFIKQVRDRILREIPSVTRVLYDITDKPPSTIEYI